MTLGRLPLLIPRNPQRKMGSSSSTHSLYVNVHSSGVKTEATHCRADLVLITNLVVRQSKASGVKQCFARQENTASKPIRLIFLVFVVGAEGNARFAGVMNIIDGS